MIPTLMLTGSDSINELLGYYIIYSKKWNAFENWKLDMNFLSEGNSQKY